MKVSGIHLWLILWRSYRAVSAYAERDVTGTLGMCLSDFGVMEVLLHKGPMPVNELGLLIQLTSGSITTAVDRLEERNLVERRMSPDDRRTRIVHLTAEGRKTIREAFASHQAALEQVADGFTNEERAVLARLMKKFGYRAVELLKEKEKS